MSRHAIACRSRHRASPGIRLLGGTLLATSLTCAHAAVDPADKAERWWDASRADRIDFSDRAASACKSRNCDSAQIRWCLNDTLKPPAAFDVREKTIGEIAARCIAGFHARR